jgi:superfamily II DNA or RNA helicase
LFLEEKSYWNRLLFEGSSMGLQFSEKRRIEELFGMLDRPLKNKGYNIYAGGGCRFLKYNIELKEYEFLVEGNVEPNYFVSINLEKIEYEDFRDGTDEPFSCDCIYFRENEACKHLAAALYYISAPKHANDLQPISKTQPERPVQSIEPIVLACDPNIPQDILEKVNFDQGATNFYPSSVTAEVGPDQITYFLSHNYYQYELKVRAEKDKIILEPNNKDQYMVQNLLDWFQKRIKRHPQDLRYLTHEGQVREMQKVLNHHDIHLGNTPPHEVFNLDFQDGDFFISAHGILEGLYHPEGVADVFEQNLIRKNRHLAEGTFLEEESDPENGKYNAGFAIQLNSYTHKVDGIHPILAKGSKNEPHKLKVKFDWLSSPHDPLLSRKDHLPELFLQIKRLNDLLDKLKTEAQKLTLFGDFHDFFEQAADYPVFLLNGYADPYYKPKKNDLSEVEICRAKLSFHIKKDPLTYSLQPVLELGEQQAFLKDIKEKLVLIDLFLIKEERQLILLDSPKEIAAIQSFWDYPIVRYTDKNKSQMEEKLIKALADDYTIYFENGMIKKEEISGKAAKQIYISEMSHFVIFKPVLNYGEKTQVNPLLNGSAVDFKTRTQLFRDPEEELAFLQEIRELHPQFLKKGNQGFFYLSFEEFVHDLWFLKALEKLKTHDIQVFGLNDLKNLKFSPHPAKVDFKLNSKQDWFEANVEVAFGNNKVRLKDIKKAIDSGGNYIELSDGSLGILPEQWLHKFGKLFRSAHQEKETLRIAKTHFNLIGEVADEKDHLTVLEEIAEKKEKLATFTKIGKTKPSKKLKAKLRHYQQEGLNWLNFLKEFGWGGILADDMGLGKTLQLIALICQEVDHKKRNPILVVAPTTLLFNWKNELEKFAPHLDYVIHHGQRYEDPKEFEKHDLILTSYGVVINDVQLLKTITFELLVADESQAIKNVQSLRHKSMVQLKAKLKIALSGTPIENNIGELFAQMNFVNPGFFISHAAFKRDYVNKFRKENNVELIAELKRKVAPFILRRTKEEVLPELPDKTEEYLYCEMAGIQRKIYDAHRNEYRDFLLKKFEEEGAEKSKMYVLEGLTRLRQICDATALIKHGESRQEAVKIDLLLNHITEKTGNHKILVFSQFVKMLELVEAELQRQNITYTYLDGKTSLKEREKRVNIFQEKAEVRVFLVSLKAGGTGLNLTAADYVYLLDPWWNPATENQAIDRCYRMGQKKNVFAYRMICKDTVEEKIIQLQEAKKKLSKDIIGEGDSILGELDRDRLLALFE